MEHELEDWLKEVGVDIQRDMNQSQPVVLHQTVDVSGINFRGDLQLGIAAWGRKDGKE